MNEDTLKALEALEGVRFDQTTFLQTQFMLTHLPKLIAIARAAIAVNNTGGFHALEVSIDGNAWECPYCDVKARLDKGLIHRDNCPYIAFVQAVKA